eukprot:SAG11_NODE_3336_length_2517_cov_2.100083_2_plen_153_part_00
MCTHFGRLSVTGVLSMYPAHLRICSNPTDLSLWSMTRTRVRYLGRRWFWQVRNLSMMPPPFTADPSPPRPLSRSPRPAPGGPPMLEGSTPACTGGKATAGACAGDVAATGVWFDAPRAADPVSVSSVSIASTTTTRPLQSNCVWSARAAKLY